MDIYVIYIIKTLLLPISSLLFIAIVGLLFIHRQPSFAMILIGFSTLVLLLLSLPIVTHQLASTQEIYPPIHVNLLDKTSAQAIIILGGGLRQSAPEYPQKVTLKPNTLERVRYGVFIANQTQLPILVTGGKVLDPDLPSEAEIMTQVLTNEFNQTVQWQEDRSRNTAENALYSKEILHQQRINHIILVTHALHMRRAVEQFKQQGFKVIPAPTAFLSKGTSISLFSFLPSATALQKSTLVIHEIMGRIWYSI